MTVTGWIGIAYTIRIQIMRYRDLEYNLASRTLGTPTPKIVVKNIMPQLVSVIAVSYTHLDVYKRQRLDKDTSGLMLFAKHGYAHARMDKQLQQKSINKHYYALVEGDTKLEEQGLSLIHI